MSTPIRANGKPKSSMKIDNAPTPHNTPASVLNTSYLKNGNPTAAGSASQQRVPQTIQEGDDEQQQRTALATALLSQKPLLLQSIQDKLDDLVGADSGYVDALPKVIRDRVYSLGALQTQLFDIEKNFQVEMFELEDKYNKLYKPLMERRAAIVAGSQQPTAEEIEQGRELAGEDDEEEDEEEEEEEEEDEDLRGVPAFWLTALENLPIVNETITDRDSEVLEHLTNVAMEYISEGQPGFKLIFSFGPGAAEFFTNTTVTKTYYYQSELGYSGDFVYDHAESEALEWVDSAHNVTVTVEERKQRNKATKQVRTVERLTPCESFFNFFDPPSADAVQALQDAAVSGEMPEDLDEDAQETEARLALDYSMGEQLKDKLIPRAVDWFTGAALEFEFADGEMPEDLDDEEDEDEDYIDEADEDDDAEDADDFAQTEQAPECKQS